MDIINSVNIYGFRFYVYKCIVIMQFDSFIRYWGFYVVEVLCIEYITYCEKYVLGILYIFMFLFIPNLCLYIVTIQKLRKLVC